MFNFWKYAKFINVQLLFHDNQIHTYANCLLVILEGLERAERFDFLETGF